jgi:hypothetical protein
VPHRPDTAALFFMLNLHEDIQEVSLEKEHPLSPVRQTSPVYTLTRMCRRSAPVA